MQILVLFEEKKLYDSAFIYFQRSMEHNVLAQSELGIGLFIFTLEDYMNSKMSMIS